VKFRGAPSVCKELAHETGEIEFRSVFYDGGRNPAKRETSRCPAPAQFTILRSAELFVEPADLVKGLPGERQVVRWQQAFAMHEVAIMARKQVEDKLGGVGVDIPGQAIYGRTTHCERRTANNTGGERFQPTWLRPAVIVRERDDFSARVLDSAIARSGWSAIRCFEKSQA
jgi:hypothetical protein